MLKLLHEAEKLFLIEQLKSEKYLLIKKIQ